ncbi:MAG: FkbM family methyltransferase [Polaromonas sp.]|nr:FkbM family methyltransferase [Polaromonas sp.]
MKIDVEGFEHAVLLGAADLIARDRPVIQMEIEKTHNPRYTDVLEWMEQNKCHGFSLEKSATKTIYYLAWKSSPLTKISLSMPKF